MLVPPRFAAAAFAVFWAFSAAHAQSPLHERIDALVRAKPDFGKIAAPLSSDAEFLRRVHLDLTGITPSSEEARAFLKDADPQRRAKLVERLLESPRYARRLENVFDVLLMDRRPSKHVKLPEWQTFLRTSFAANKPYNELVREMLSSDGNDPKTRPAARFFLDRDAEPHQITRDVSRLFLGMNLQCAQCHDHPLVNPYRQDHYYGIFAFFNRSFLFTDKTKKTSVYAEKAEGDASYQSVFMAKVTKQTGPRLPDGKPLAEPSFKKGEEYVVALKKDERPQPKFSRRAQLAGLLLENPRFPRTTVNRVWSLLLGRGIVHPVEFDHEDNPPSHPELIKMLSEEFVAKNYDLKHLIRGIVLSEAYQRSSLLPAGGVAPNPETFAIAALRPLSPEQLAWSMMQAVGMIDAERKAAPKSTDEAIFTKLAGNEAIFVKLFAGAPGEPSDPNAFEATLDQTLFVNNGDLLRGWLAPRPGNLTARLADLKDAAALADELYLNVLSRLPTAEEKDDVADFLKRRESNRPEAIQDLVWAMLASAEFRFNH